jgi:hypothetical protein
MQFVFCTDTLLITLSLFPKCNDKMFFFRFTLIKEHLIEFNQLAMANSCGSDDMLNRVMPRDNIGLAALLKTNETAWENCKSCNVMFTGGGERQISYFYPTQ